MQDELLPGVVSIDHVADVGLEITAPSLAELFRRAAAGMRVLTSEDEGSAGPVAATGEVAVHDVSLEAQDLASLLLLWLRELLYLAEVHGFGYEDAEFERLEGGVLRARVRGQPHQAAPVRELKGVTYHGLCVEPRSDGWRARVIFDV